MIQIRGSLRGARLPDEKASGTEVGRNEIDRGEILLIEEGSGNTPSASSFSGGGEMVWERDYGDELVALVPLRIQL